MRHLIFIIIGLLISCRGLNKLTCYEDTLAKAKKSSAYLEVMKAAQASVPKIVAVNNIDWQNSDVFVDSSYVSSTMIDDAIFFNPDSSKSILLVLLKSVEDAKDDIILYVQGTKAPSGWTFAANRLPLVPQIRYGIRKKEIDGVPVNSSFDVLSKEGREFILTAGKVKRFGCTMDYEYWFGE